MKALVFSCILLITTIIFNIDSAEGRGHGHHHGHNRHHYRELSAESSSESYEERRHRGRSSDSEEDFHMGGRGWFDSIKDAAYDLGNKAYEKASNTDWKEIGNTAWDKAKKMADAAQSRKKRSYDSMPLPVEQLITEPENLEDQGRAKTLYNKRSIKKERKSFFEPKNQLNRLD